MNKNGRSSNGCIIYHFKTWKSGGYSYESIKPYMLTGQELIKYDIEYENSSKQPERLSMTSNIKLQPRCRDSLESYESSVQTNDEPKQAKVNKAETFIRAPKRYIPKLTFENLQMLANVTNESIHKSIKTWIKDVYVSRINEKEAAVVDHLHNYRN